MTTNWTERTIPLTTWDEQESPGVSSSWGNARWGIDVWGTTTSTTSWTERTQP